MSDVEFDRLLDAVRTAIEPLPGEDIMQAHFTPSKAANDNAGPWPLIPFPQGWYAAC